MSGSMPRKQRSPVGLQGPRVSGGCAAAAATNNRRITAENFERTLVRGIEAAAIVVIIARRYLNIVPSAIEQQIESIGPATRGAFAAVSSVCARAMTER